MEVILKENFPSLGFIGDKVTVRPGFGRNFLIPRGLAVEATKRNAGALKHALQSITAKRVKLRAAAQEIHSKLGSVKLEFRLKIGQDGKAFGSITAKEIEKALADLGIEVDRRQIRLLAPIKKIGKHKIEIKLHAEVVAPLEVTVGEEAKAVKVMAEGEEKVGRKKISRIQKELKAKELENAKAMESSSPDVQEAAETKPKRKKKEAKKESASDSE